MIEMNVLMRCIGGVCVYLIGNKDKEKKYSKMFGFYADDLLLWKDEDYILTTCNTEK